MRFPDGVWLADLTPLAEPRWSQTVASVLDIRQAPGRSLLETLSDQLRHRRILLVLDNCEHVIATSRRARRYAAPRRGGPDDSRHEPRGAGDCRRNDVAGAVADTARRGQSLGSADDLLQYEAVRLLVERAAAVDSGFTITR